jgi:hypothetical protein
MRFSFGFPEFVCVHSPSVFIAFGLLSFSDNGMVRIKSPVGCGGGVVFGTVFDCLEQSESAIISDRLSTVLSSMNGVCSVDGGQLNISKL